MSGSLQPDMDNETTSNRDQAERQEIESILPRSVLDLITEGHRTVLLLLKLAQLKGNTVERVTLAELLDQQTLSLHLKTYMG